MKRRRKILLTPPPSAAPNAPLCTLRRISRDASTNACSTFTPLFALASTKSKPSFAAQAAPSSLDTSRGRCFAAIVVVAVGVAVVVVDGIGAVERSAEADAEEGEEARGCDDVNVDVEEVEAVTSADSAEGEVRGGGGGGTSSPHKSTLLPTRMQVRFGSACSRTSASQFLAFKKPI